MDEFQNTSRPGIYAVGDVCGKALLTPGRKSLYHLIINDLKIEFFFFFIHKTVVMCMVKMRVIGVILKTYLIEI